MFSPASLLATLCFALAVAAAGPVVIRDSPISLPIAKRVNFTGPASLHGRDQARIQHLRRVAETKKNGQFATLASDAVVNVPAENQAVEYTVNVRSSRIQFRHTLWLTAPFPQVGVGSPATTCKFVAPD